MSNPEGEIMVVVPLSKPVEDAGEEKPGAPASCSASWVTYAAAATLAAGGALLVCGHRRAGMVAAASGAALAMLDQRDTVVAWWDALPNYLAEIQEVLGQAQETLGDLNAQRDRLNKALAR
jgi:hypothetical protein